MSGFWYLYWLLDKPEGKHFDGVSHPYVRTSDYARLFQPQILPDGALINHYCYVLGLFI